MEAKQYATKQPIGHWRNKKKIPEDKWKGNTTIQNLRDASKSSSKWDIYSDTSLPKETRKISNKQPNLTPKGTKKEEQTNPKLVEGKKS